MRYKDENASENDRSPSYESFEQSLEADEEKDREFKKTREDKGGNEGGKAKG